MKTYTQVLIALFIFFAITQAEAQRIGDLKGINYQAVAIDDEGKEIVGMDIDKQPLYEKEIGVRFSILKNQDGEVEYQETHSALTDQYGLFSLVIGQGVQTGAGSYSDLLSMPWIDADQWLKVEISIKNDGNYKVVSLMQFMAVPYAFYTDDIADDAITTEKILNATIVNEDVADTTLDLTTKVTNVLPLANGGTGLDSVPLDHILVGNDTSALKTLEVSDSVMVFSNKNGLAELFRLIPGPRASITVDEVNKTVAISAVDQSGGPNKDYINFSTGNIPIGGQQLRNIPYPGVVLGDIILVTSTTDLEGVIMSAYVSQDDRINVIFFNGTGSARNLSGSLKIANFGQ